MVQLSYIVFFCLLLCASPFLQAQQFAFQTYTRASGLPSDYILCMYQDREGFLWIGTDRGAARYDGHAFKTFSVSDGLGSNFVYTIYQDSEGFIWFGTIEGGVSRFDGVRFETFNTSKGLLSNNIVSISQDGVGRMYFSSDSGLTIMRNNRFQSRHYRGGTAIILRLADGSILFHYGLSLLRIAPTDDFEIQQTEIHLPRAARGFAGPGGGLSGSTVLRNGNICISSDFGLMELKNVNSERAESAQFLKIRGIVALEADREGALWCGLRNSGVLKWQLGAPTIYATKDGFPREQVRCIMRDYEGNLWLGTLGGGLQKLLGTHLLVYGRQGGLPAENITTVFQDSKDRVWFGAASGPSVLAGGKIVAVKTLPRAVDVRVFGEDLKGQIYIGTFTRLLGPANFEKLDSEKPVPWRKIDWGVSALHIQPAKRSGQSYSDATMWVGTYGDGTYKFEGGDSTKFYASGGIASNMIESIEPFRDDVWFLSRNLGASRLQAGRFENFSRNTGLPSDAIYSVYEEPNGTTWFGTDAGLARVRGRDVRIFSEKNGINGKYVLGIFPSGGESQRSLDRASLWIVTERSLHRYESGMIHRYGSVNLLPSHDASMNNLHYDTRTSILWLATTSGAVRIDLKNARQLSMPPKISILEATADTLRFYRASNLVGTVDLPELSHDQNDVSVTYAGLTLEREEEVEFVYKLSGLDGLWSSRTRERSVRYRNLPPGDYQFAVQVINVDGIASLQPASISFRILPPFWQTWWFRVSVAAFFLGIFGGAVRYLSTRKLQEKLRGLEKQRALQEERERISRDLHDHAGAQLTNIISGIELATKYSGTSQKKTKRLLASLDEDARVSMSQLRETIWALKTNATSVQEFATVLEEYARRQLRYRRTPKFQLVNRSTSSLRLSPIQVLNLFRIYQEALTNALKHARAKTILVELLARDGWLGLIVRDDGRGGKKNAVGMMNGQGVPNMHRRAGELNGVCTIGPSEKGGMEVKVEIPVEKNSS